MHAFYLSGPARTGETVPLLEEESRHALKVLRLTAGEKIVALDGQGGRFSAELCPEGGRALARLMEALPDNEPARRLTLYQGLPKADKLEWIVQKGTELGVSAFCPVEMRNSVARVKGGKEERLERIAREAVKQCRRGRVPEILPAARLEAVLPQMARHELLLVPWENAQGRTLRSALQGKPEARDIGLVIGPEGGIDPKEIEALQALGALPVTLGPRILRTETAALAAAALLLEE